MATGEADTLDLQTVRKELLAMYHARAGHGFLQSLLDAASDPIRPWIRQSGGGSTHCWSCCLSSRRSWPWHLSTSLSSHGEARGRTESFPNREISCR